MLPNLRQGWVNLEYLFLDTTRAVNSSWNSADVTGMSQNVSYTLFIKMTLLAKATSATVGTFSFPDVMKMRYEYFLKANPVTPFFTEERWFARNVGLIYNTFFDGTNTDIYKVGRYLVN